MNPPFNTPENTPDQPFGFGFGPGAGLHDRRALHEHRRQARREFRDHLREHRGPGGFPGFGPGFPGFGPGFPGFGPGFGFGPGGPGGGRGHRGGRRGGGRGRRGDVRAAILRLLTERPMHGYEMIQEIAERSQQLWKPSPGSVYPTLQLLVDEGLLVATESDGSKKLFELTEQGRTAAAEIETPPWEEITEGADPTAMGLRSAVGQLMGAIAQSAHAATTEQQQRIVEIVNTARREIYQVLGED
jgi:DNA-binding PadR family transcriptional regulator